MDTQNLREMTAFSDVIKSNHLISTEQLSPLYH